MSKHILQTMVRSSAAKRHCCFAAKAKSDHSPEDVSTAAAGKPPKGNAGLSHIAGQQEVFRLAILPMRPPQTPPSSHPTLADALDADSLPTPPAACANTSSQTQHNSRLSQLQWASSVKHNVTGNRRLWLLPLTTLQENEAADLAHEDSGGPLAEQCRALLKHVLTGNSSTVCFNMQGQHSTASLSLVTVCLSVCLSVCLFVCLCLCLCMCLCVCVCMSVAVSVCV